MISRESQDTAEVVQVELGTTVSRASAKARRSTATTSRQSPRCSTSKSRPTRSATIPSRWTRSRAARAREWAARAALDAALHDLQGKFAGVPVWRLLGVRRVGPPTSWTIWLGDPDEMARAASGRPVSAVEAEARCARRPRHRPRARGAQRTEVPLQVDVNEYWTLDEALETLPQLAELGVEYCEQPLPAGDPGGAGLKALSPIPIYVDEDCHRLRTSPPAPSARTASTSSSRSQAASARRCA